MGGGQELFTDRQQRGFRGVPRAEGVLGGCQKLIMSEVSVELLVDIAFNHFHDSRNYGIGSEVCGV